MAKKQRKRAPRQKKLITVIEVPWSDRPVAVWWLPRVVNGEIQYQLEFRPRYSRQVTAVTMAEIYRWAVRFTTGNLLEDVGRELERARPAVVEGGEV